MIPPNLYSMLVGLIGALLGIAGGSPAWEWAAAAFAGVEAVTIDGVVHAITGTPQVWMP